MTEKRNNPRQNLNEDLNAAFKNVKWTLIRKRDTLMSVKSDYEDAMDNLDEGFDTLLFGQQGVRNSLRVRTNTSKIR
jgi:hypothetical protein